MSMGTCVHISGWTIVFLQSPGLTMVHLNSLINICVLHRSFGPTTVHICVHGYLYANLWSDYSVPAHLHMLLQSPGLTMVHLNSLINICVPLHSFGPTTVHMHVHGYLCAHLWLDHSVPAYFHVLLQFPGLTMVHLRSLINICVLLCFFGLTMS
jgi:hypothetical protein